MFPGTGKRYLFSKVSSLTLRIAKLTAIWVSQVIFVQVNSQATWLTAHRHLVSRLTVDGAVSFLHHKHRDNFTCRFLRRMWWWWNSQAHALRQKHNVFNLATNLVYVFYS